MIVSTVIWNQLENVCKMFSKKLVYRMKNRLEQIVDVKYDTMVKYDCGCWNIFVISMKYTILNISITFIKY